MKSATFRRLMPPPPDYGLPPKTKLSKKKLRELRVATERQCRNGGQFDRPSICAADLLSLLNMLEDERTRNIELAEDLTGIVGSR